MTRSAVLGFSMLATLAVAACDRDQPVEPIAAAAPPPLAATPSSAPAGDRGSNDSIGAPLTVTLAPASGSAIRGELRVSGDGPGVRFAGLVEGFAPNSEHGFHVHETGDCSAPDASSAGNHFNPTGAPHGAPDSDRHHAGDLPNLHADAYGQAIVDIRIDTLELGGGGATDILGRALVVHALPDDFTEQPSGGSGERIACGVLGNAAVR